MGRNPRNNKGKGKGKGLPRGVKPPAEDSTKPPAEASNKPPPTAVGAGAMVDPQAAVAAGDSDSDQEPQPRRKRLRRPPTRLIDSEAEEGSDGDGDDYYQECGGEDLEDYHADESTTFQVDMLCNYLPGGHPGGLVFILGSVTNLK